MKNSFISFESFNTPEYQAPSAWLEHISFAFELINKLKPKTFVELGVHYGVSYFSICQAIKSNAIPCTCYGIDSWQGDEHAGFYEENLFNNVNEYNQEHYASFSHLIKSYFDEAVSGFEDKSIDLLHIDGLHTYEAVKKDFETWEPKLSDSSIVMFHDITMKDKGFGVYRLWDDLSRIYPSFSFYHGWGLGVLATGSLIAPELAPLFENNEDNMQEIRYCYEKLGSSISDKFALGEYQEKEQRLMTDIRNISADLKAIKGQKEQQALILAEMQAQLNTQKNEISHKEDHITAILAELQIAKDNISEKEKRIISEQLKLQEQREENVKLVADIQKNTTMIENYSLQTAQLLKQIEEYRNSNSWKITRPFRMIKIAIDQLLK